MQNLYRKYDFSFLPFLSEGGVSLSLLYKGKFVDVKIYGTKVEIKVEIVCLIIHPTP